MTATDEEASLLAALLNDWQAKYGGLAALWGKDLTPDARQMLARLEPLIAARLLEPIRAIHRPNSLMPRLCSVCAVLLPCPTIAAIDEETTP